MTRASVWDGYDGVVSIPAGTPDLKIRADKDPYRVCVYADGKLVHSAEQYPDAHLWTMNEYRLTSTMMLPVYEDFAAHREQPAVAPELP